MSLHHVVLGGTGVVGRETAAALRAADQNVTVVGRSPAPESGSGSLVVSAELRDLDDTFRAVRGADVVYLVLGLPYRLAVWRRDWPRVVENVIAGAVAEGAHLVYFDNVYVYGRVDGSMTEDSPIRPSSRKGEVRAASLRKLEAGRRRAQRLRDDLEQRGVPAALARRLHQRIQFDGSRPRRPREGAHLAHRCHPPPLDDLHPGHRCRARDHRDG